MSKQSILIGVITLGAIFASCSTANGKSEVTSGSQTATANVAPEDTTKAKNIFFVDVRTPGEFAQGSVTGAVNIPLDQVQNRIGEFKGKEEIVVFCRSGNRSSQAKAILEQNGITNVINGGSWEDVKKTYNK
jgi:rhodanese-related sulfurtransferase